MKALSCYDFPFFSFDMDLFQMHFEKHDTNVLIIICDLL